MTPRRAVEVRVLRPGDDVGVVSATLGAVWGGPHAIVPREVLVALVHCDSFVAVATAGDDDPIGASVGLLGLELDSDGARRTILHSHVTGVVPAVRASGVGWALKQHQREWAADRGVAAITWTFDPLVRRNAWFNITRLGVDVVGYHRRFYGSMVDEINVGDESDRLYVRWPVDATEHPHGEPTAGSAPESRDAASDMRVATPEDVVDLRRRDPAAVRDWRRRHRDTLEPALATGGRVVGFTRDGDYLIESGR